MIEKLIKRIAKQLDKAKIPYMIIGGQAVLIYGSPRLTRDIDITLGIDTDEITLIEKLCKKLKLKILTQNPKEFVKDTRVLPAEATKLKIRVDFIFSFSPYEKQAIKKARKVRIDGYPAKFASCEDVIIHKMFAGRAIDEEDVRNIFIKNRNKINLKYIKNWLSKFSKIPGQKDILERFNRIIKQI